MRKLLITALAVASISAAQAEEWAMPNQAGGEIRLTAAECPSKGKAWSVMYSYSPSGGAQYGCWFFSDGMVHVSWKDGTSSVFKGSLFRPTGKPTNNSKGYES